MATTFRNEKLFCTCCGGEFKLNYPMSVEQLAKKVEAFDMLHKDCKQTYIEQIADQNKNVYEKAMWWMGSGEANCFGLSFFERWKC